MNFKKIIVPIVAFLALIGIGFIVYYSNPDNRPMKPYDVPQFYTFKGVVEKHGYTYIETNYAEIRQSVAQMQAELQEESDYDTSGIQVVYTVVSKSIEEEAKEQGILLDNGLPFQLEYCEYSSYDEAKKYYSNWALSAALFEERNVLVNGQIKKELDDSNKKGYIVMKGNINSGISEKDGVELNLLTGIDVNGADFTYFVMCINDNRVCCAYTSDSSAVPELQSMLEELEMPIPADS